MLNTEEKEFILRNKDKDINKLSFQYYSKNDLDYPFLIQQIAAKQKYKGKIPLLCNNDDIIFPPQLNLEQSSSETTATYKSTIVTGETGCDLTGGFGIDTIFLAKGRLELSHVEPNSSLSEIVHSNLQTLELDSIVQTHNTTAEIFIEREKQFDFVYIDPSRRTNKGKVVFLEDYEPNVIALQEKILEKSNTILVKTSPMLDIKDTLKKLQYIAEIHVVSIKNEVKEVLYLVKNKWNKNITLKTINFVADNQKQCFEFPIVQSNIAPSYSSPLTYLYEPNKAIMKSGGYNLLAQKYNLTKLHPNSHLYTSTKCINEYPGRVFKIHSIKKAAKKEFSTISKANITVRNFPMTIAEIRKKLKIKDGGNIYLFATTLIDDKHVILDCEKIF